MPLVSIIIPVYNEEKNILDTLKCCINQKDLTEKEIIVVDDHSSDKTWALISSFAQSHPCIRLFKNNKKGANSARNFGFQKSSGDYIQFLDADDILSQNKIRSQIEALKNMSEGTIASCPWAHFINHIDEASFISRKIWKDYEDPIYFLIDSWTGGGMMANSCWLCPRAIIEKAGPWDEGLLKNQDGEFFCRVLLNSKSISFQNKARVYYRKPAKHNVSQKRSYQADQSLLDSYISYENHIRQKRDSEEIRLACAENYQRFIYETHPRNPDLLIKARKQIDELQVRTHPTVGGYRFQIISKFIGFKNALKLRKLFSK
jgi:glycosyltransferase involved in cell wall biosynthesis